MRLIPLLCISTCLAGLGFAPKSDPTTRPYSGLTLRDDDTGKVLVAHIAPGPLEGRGFRSPHLERGDTILDVNGQPMTAKAFEELIAASRPGDEIVLRVSRTGSPDVTAVPIAAAEGKLEELRFRLAVASEWVGPVEFPHPLELGSAVAAIDTRAGAPTTAPTALESLIDAQLDSHDLRQPTDKLCALLADVQQKGWGHNALAHVAYGFVNPKRMLRLQKSMTDPLPAFAADPRQVLVQSALLLDVPPATLAAPSDLSDPIRAADWLVVQLDLADKEVERAFAKIDPAQRPLQAERMDALLRHVATPKTVESSPRVNEFIDVMQSTMQIDYAALFEAAGRVADVLNIAPVTPSTSQPTTQPELPEELKSAVGGTIVAFKHSSVGWVVVGGVEANTYDLSRLAGVIDLGGDDVYTFPKGSRAPVQVIVDQAGDDRYVANDDGIGPGSAVMGISLLHDLAGNDRYEGGASSCGAGVMGIGILLDRAGDDHYVGTAWCQGAGVYGAGAILDLSGSDTYVASIDSQAIGGPRGVGLLLDASGDDLYRANGPVPSAYGTPAVSYAMSQGVGLGFRRFDTGGIGILEDLAGNDRYEGGEFTQGGGYYFGLGLLHDQAGSDVYFGNRYSQAFAAHQAIGILVDDAGDDTYWGMTAANQSGSWDKTLTVLLDRAGNDTYRGDGLSQGSASMQAIAWLIDLDGIDHYTGAGTATQGQGGGNTYSYLATGAFSWSMLLDGGGDPDFYSSGRGNGQSLSTGAPNAEHPEASDLSGLFVDTDAMLDVP